MTEEKQTAIFLFHQPEKNLVLVEKRLPTASFPNQLLYPGGAVEPSEIDHPEVALRREVIEELGVIPLEFARVPVGKLYGETGYLLLPFHIKKWEGDIPEKILDKGNPLFWIPTDEALRLPTKSLRTLTQKFIEYLQESD